jgi:hypothetical protein
MGGGAIDMTSGLSKTPAILQGWYAGGGWKCTCRILFGTVNPSGNYQ